MAPAAASPVVQQLKASPADPRPAVFLARCQRVGPGRRPKPGSWTVVLATARALALAVPCGASASRAPSCPVEQVTCGSSWIRSPSSAAGPRGAAAWESRRGHVGRGAASVPARPSPTLSHHSLCGEVETYVLITFVFSDYRAAQPRVTKREQSMGLTFLQLGVSAARRHGTR